MTSRTRQSRIASLPLVLALTSHTVADEGRGPLPVAEAVGQLRAMFSSPIALSPDGSRVALTLQDPRRQPTGSKGTMPDFSETGAPGVLAGCDLRLIEVESGDAKDLTAGRGTSWGPNWSPDGQTLAFYSDRDGAAQLWAWEVRSGQRRRLSAAIVHPYYPFEVPQWTLDGKRLLVKLLPEGEKLDSARRGPRRVPGPALPEPGTIDGAKVRVYRSPVPQGGGRTGAYFEHIRADLALVDTESGTVDRIARGVPVRGCWLSPDQVHIAYVEDVGLEEPGIEQDIHDIRIFSRADRSTRTAAGRVRMDMGIAACWSPTGSHLAVRTSGLKAKGDFLLIAADGGGPINLTERHEGNFGDGWVPPCWSEDGRTLYCVRDGHLWAIPVDGGAPAPITRDGAPNLTAILTAGIGRVWSPDGGRSIVVATRDPATKRAGFTRVELSSGRCTVLLEEDKVHERTAVAADGSRIAFLAEDAAHPADLWSARPDFREPRRVSRISPRLEEYRHGTARVIEWRSLDGRPLRGALLLPPGHAEGEHHPLVVRVYPTEMGSDLVNNYGLDGPGVDNRQLLATRGFAVLTPDLPIRPESVPTDLLKMVMPGVDRAVELGYADPERLGVMGHSFGGYAVVSLITQTTRFKAAVSCNGFGDLVSYYGHMAANGNAANVESLEDGYMKLGGPPWVRSQRYIEQSPVFHLDRVETPLLMVIGSLDYVPPGNIGEVFVGLRRMGKEAEFAVYEGDGHWAAIWGYANAVDYCNRIIDWFDTHIGPHAQRREAGSRGN
jgi:dipeptidyl aminopeptidase/acylaminoacyl peptidase